MKFVFINIAVILYLIHCKYSCHAEERLKLKIGAFFTEENSQAEAILKSLIYRQNTMESRVQFEADYKLISKTDGFGTSKILCDMTENTMGLVGVIGPDTNMTIPITQSLCAKLELPHIQYSWRPSVTYSKTAINYYPDPALLSEGLAVMVRNLHWKSFVVLYEDDVGLIRLQDVLAIQDYDENNKRNTIAVKQLSPDGDQRAIFKAIFNSTENKIILDCKTENIINILQQASDMKLYDSFTSYFLTSLDAHTLDLSLIRTLDNSEQNRPNITTVRIFDINDDNYKSSVDEFQDFARNFQIKDVEFEQYSITTESALLHDAVKEFFTTVSGHVASGQDFTQLGMNCEKDNTFSTGLILATYMKLAQDSVPYNRPFTHPIGFDEITGARNDFTLYLVSGNQDDLMGTWSPKAPEEYTYAKGAKATEQKLIEDIKKTKIIVSSKLGAPYLTELNDDGEISYVGYSNDLIDAIAKKVGFEYEIKITGDGKNGNFDASKNQWTGVIGDILQRRAHLGICDLTITQQRREVVDFSLPFMTLGIGILYRRPEVKEVDIFAFLKPFSNDVWFYTATLYLAISIVQYFVSRLSPADWENPHPCDANPEELENIWDIKNCLWLTLGSIMTQGCDILPKGVSVRIATGMWWFFTLIIANSYMANLAAFLTQEGMKGDITSAEDLVKQTRVKYGTLEGGTTEQFFKESNFSTFQKMWTAMQTSKPSVFVKTNDEGVARVASDKHRLYAFLMESSSIEFQIEKNCTLISIGGRLDNKAYGIAMPPEYPYRSLINGAILELQESGKLTDLKEKWWKQNGTSCPQPPEGTGELRLANVGGIFLVLGVGLGVAVILALFEFLWNVRNVSVEEHLSYWEAFKVEFIFACKIWITKKRTKPLVSGSSSHSGSEPDRKSMTHSIMRGATSFLNLDILNKVGTPNNRHED